MLPAFGSLLPTALADQAFLLLNHILVCEPAALLRLRAHAGGCIQLHFQRSPGWLAALSPMTARITAAGLLERQDSQQLPAASLRIGIDVANPAMWLAQWLSSGRPRVDIQGDAQLAAELNWLTDNLRWDVQDDLESVLGPVGTHELVRFGGELLSGVRKTALTLSTWAATVGASAPTQR